MPWMNVSQLAELTGKSKQTVISRIKTLDFRQGRHNAKDYLTQDALPLIYAAVADKENLDLTKERARLAHHQANKTNMEERMLQGELLEADVVEEIWTQQILAMRQTLLSTPTKLAAELTGAESKREIKEIAQEHIDQACEALSSPDASVYRDRSRQKGSKAGRAASAA